MRWATASETPNNKAANIRSQFLIYGFAIYHECEVILNAHVRLYAEASRKSRPRFAAIRETWEETGLIVELTGLLGVYGGPELVIDYPNGDKASYISTIFRGRIVGGRIRPDGDETLDVRYFTREELSRVDHAKWLDVAMPAL